MANKFEEARRLVYEPNAVWPLLNLVNPTDVVLTQYIRDHIKEKHGEAACGLVDAELAAPWQRFEDEVLGVWERDSYGAFFCGTGSDAPRQRHLALLAWYQAVTAWWDRADSEWLWRWWACVMLRLQTVRQPQTPRGEARRVRLTVVEELRRHADCPKGFSEDAVLIPFFAGYGGANPAYLRGTYPASLPGGAGPRSAFCVAWSSVAAEAEGSPDTSPVGPRAITYELEDENRRRPSALPPLSAMGPMGPTAHDDLRNGGVSLALSAQQVGIELRPSIRMRFGLRRWALPWGTVV